MHANRLQDQITALLFAPRRWWMPLILYASASFLMIGPHVLPPTSITCFGNAPQDSYIFLWGFWWTKKALLALQNPYWTDFLFYPTGTTLTMHSFPLLYNLFSLPFQFVVPGTDGLVIALNMIVYSSFVLSGWGMYLLAFRVTGSRSGSIVAGLVYAFMPFHMMNMTSLHLLAIEFLPFYVFYLLKLKERPSISSAFAVALWLALIYFTSLEYALFIMLLTAIWLLFALVHRPDGTTLRLLKHLGFSAVFFILAASPQLLQQASIYHSRSSAIEMSVENPTFWSPALLSLITPTRFHPVYGRALSFAGEYEDNRIDTWGMRSEATLGIVVIGLAVISIFRIRRDRSTFWILTALCFLSLALGPYLRLTGTRLTSFPMPYLFLYKVLPLLRESRDPTRFLPVAMLALSIMAAFGMRACLQWLHRQSSRALTTTLIALLVLFEYLPGGAQRFRPAVHPLYQSISEHPGDYAVMDLAREPYNLVQQIFHQKKLTSLPVTVPRSPALSATMLVERDFRHPEPCLRLDPTLLSRRLGLHATELQDHDIRYAVLSPGPMLPLQLRLAELLGARTEYIEGLFLVEFRKTEGWRLKS